MRSKKQLLRIVDRDYDEFDIIAIPLLIAQIRKYLLTVRKEVVLLFLTNNEYLQSKMLSDMTLSQEQEWLEYQQFIEDTITKEFDKYIKTISVSLYYASDTSYDILKDEVVDKYFTRNAKHMRGLGGKVMLTYLTEYTRTTSMLTNYDYMNIPGKEKKWVYTYESKTQRTHHHAHDGVVSKDGYFIVDGHKTLAPGMFGIPSEDMNCRCRVTLVDEPL